MSVSTSIHYHFGRAEAVRARRQAVLDAAYEAQPERFRRRPSAPRIPKATWINRPEDLISALEPV
jgi:putative transposase